MYCPNMICWCSNWSPALHQSNVLTLQMPFKFGCGVMQHAVCWVSTTSLPTSWSCLPRNIGLFYLTPSGSRKSSIINPLSAIISPSFCNWFGNPDFHKMCIRDTTCVIVRTQNNVTYPAGLITINVLPDL